MTDTEKKAGEFAVVVEDMKTGWSFVRLVGTNQTIGEDTGLSRLYADKCAKEINSAFSARVRPLVEALEKIGNMVGGPTMQYSPEIEREELLQRMDVVSQVVRKALEEFRGR